MAREKFERKKPHVNIGTIGHVDNGKTTLTKKFEYLTKLMRFLSHVRSVIPPLKSCSRILQLKLIILPRGLIISKPFLGPDMVG